MACFALISVLGLEIACLCLHARRRCTQHGVRLNECLHGRGFSPPGALLAAERAASSDQWRWKAANCLAKLSCRAPNCVDSQYAPRELLFRRAVVTDPSNGWDDRELATGFPVAIAHSRSGGAQPVQEASAPGRSCRRVRQRFVSLYKKEDRRICRLNPVG